MSATVCLRSKTIKCKELVTAKLGDFVTERGINEVALLKTDIEGYDVDALETGEKLFERHIVENLCFESTPGGALVSEIDFGANAQKLGKARNHNMMFKLREFDYFLAELPYSGTGNGQPKAAIPLLSDHDIVEVVNLTSGWRSCGFDGVKRPLTYIWATLDPDAFHSYNLWQGNADMVGKLAAWPNCS